VAAGHAEDTCGAGEGPSALVSFSCVWGLLWAEPTRQLLRELGTQSAMLLVLAATVAVVLRR